MPEPKADYTFSIVADSGYESTTTGSITADQYGDVMAVLHGKPTRDEMRLARIINGIYEDWLKGDLSPPYMQFVNQGAQEILRKSKS